MPDNELELLLRKIDKKADFIHVARSVPEPDRFSTGVLQIDNLMGGGWPTGRIVTLYGRYGAAKSTLASYTVADAQARGKSCLWIDAENSFEPSWAETLGVDVDNLAVIKNRSLEHCLKVVSKAQESGHEFDVIVIDSISAIQSIKYLDDDQHAIGSQARATKEMLIKLSYWFPHALVLVVSQMTTDFSQQYAQQVPTGGNALKHESSFMLYLNYTNGDMKKGVVKIGDRLIEKEVAYIDMTWIFKKARSSEVGARGTFRFIPGIGVDRVKETFSQALFSGVISERGRGFFSYKDDYSWHGKDKVLSELANDENLLKEVRDEISARGPIAPEREPTAGEDSSEEID